MPAYDTWARGTVETPESLIPYRLRKDQAVWRGVSSGRESFSSAASLRQEVVSYCAGEN